MKSKKDKRAIEVLTKELNENIYVNMKARILGRYYGEQDAKFAEMLRSGMIVTDYRAGEDWDFPEFNWITT